MNKKKVFTLALAVCLIAILSMGSLAWFSAEDSVTNDFNVADSDGDGRPDFTVEVWEQIDTNGDGDFNEVGDVEYDNDGLVYENIQPGDVLSKIANVENTGAYNQYIRMYVTFHDAWFLQNACLAHGLSTDLMTWISGIDDTLWTRSQFVNEDTVNNTVTYCFYLNEVLEPDEVKTLFTQITIPGLLNNDDLSGLTSSINVTVRAEALQVDNLPVSTAPEAFNYVSWEPFTEYDI